MLDPNVAAVTFFDVHGTKLVTLYPMKHRFVGDAALAGIAAKLESIDASGKILRAGTVGIIRPDATEDFPIFGGNTNIGKGATVYLSYGVMQSRWK